MTLLEICVDSAAGIAAAIEGGADRIELCGTLELGGLTPSPGLMALAANIGRPVRAMIRPRAGDFVFDPEDLDTMRGDIATARHHGLEGVVLGASLPDGRLDLGLLARLAEAAEGMKRTLHRAFDLVPDIDEAVEQAIALGFDTILTSGRAGAAPDGLADLQRVYRAAAGRIVIMAGAGINSSNVRDLLGTAPLGAIHGSCSVPAPLDSAAAQNLGFMSPARRRTDAAKVAALKAAIDNIFD
ncbi:copper homeostasis protein CutC [Nostoc sp. 3335mG]|nr:copper homeostasis protein CutC [Nostoc sp. 3335mG]